MRPIEEFVYVGNQVIVPDQASLMRCYYPIIGSEGYALYQYFVAFYDNGNRRHKFAAILNHLNFGMQPLQEALAVLTAVDLLAFYQSPQGFYVIELKSPLTIEQFLKHAVYSSLLEQKISEPAVDALKPAGLQGLQDLSKRFSDVFTDERLAQKSVSEIKPKNSFDLTSFRNRMQADGLVFTDEKTDVPEIYKLSETHGMNWYDTYLLAKKTAVNHQIIVKRMQVQLEQAQAQTLGGDSALTETEEKILKAVRSEKPINYLQGAKGPSGTVTNSEKQILTDLAQRCFMDEVINLMVAYSLGRTRSTNVNREYISKLANDFAFKNILTAEQGLLALRSGYDKKSQQAKADSKKKTNVPSWSNPDYDNQTSQEQILADPRVASFIQEHSLSQDEIKRSLPKFNQFLVECRKVKEGDTSYIAKGYEPILTMNEGYADVTYKETRQLKEQQEQQAIAKRINLVSLPQSYRKITFADIALDDVARVDTFESLVDFVANYPSLDQKGLYIYGDMGVGKSFMLAAMAHELSETKKVATTIIHYPSFTIDVKNGIKDGSVKEQIDAVKQAEVLVLDDIGAEQFSSWIRDDVLQVILQHRMIEELPTFFTSNYSFADLEAKLSNGRQGDETWQAKRVMERIRFLAKEVHLKGVNRR